MKKIEFKRVSAQNFFCFGNEGVEINFKEYGNVVLVNGKNLDSFASNMDEPPSNGAGKSSIPEIIVYGFYGKTIKKPKKLSHKDVINNKNGKKLKIEIEWDKYKLVRSRKPDSLRLWESEEAIWDDTTEITLGGMPATQKKIEDILGLSYESFVNIAVFTDNNSVSFLECDAAEKRVIVENLLSLEKFRNYQDSAKKLLKTEKDNLQGKSVALTYAQKSKEDNDSMILKYKNDIKQHKQNMLSKFKTICDQIENCKMEIKNLQSNDAELLQYNSAQEKLPQIDLDIAEAENIKDKIQVLLNKANSLVQGIKNEINDLDGKIHPLKLEKATYENQIKNITGAIEKINKLEEGVTCQHCLSPISKDNYASVLTKHKEEALEIKGKWNDIKSQIEELEKLKTEKSDQKTSMTQAMDLQDEKLRNITNKHSNLLREKTAILNMKKPESEAKINGLNNKIEILKNESEKYDINKISVTPYDSYLAEAESKAENLAQEESLLLDEIEKIRTQMKYYEYWSSAFGDQGIRKYVIDGIVPALNENLAYWLGILINNNLRIKFDNQFEDYIDKVPEESQLSYFAISGGQKRRINLALSQAFAHIMSLNTGRYLNLVFLDEVTSNIDKSGAEAIYQMIVELAQDKRVFITTHDQNLLEYLKGCETLNLVMKNGETKLEN